MVIGTSDGSLFIYAIKNLHQQTDEKDLDEIIKQSLISQLENVKDDEDNSQELMEKHQLELMEKDKKDKDDFDEDDQKFKMDAFEAKLDKIKTDNEAFLRGKKNKTKTSDKDKQSDDSSEGEK